MTQILLKGSAGEYSACGSGHKVIIERNDMSALVLTGLRSLTPKLVVDSLHQSGHVDTARKELLPEAQKQLELLTKISAGVGGLEFGAKAPALLVRAMYSTSQIIGIDMSNNDVDSLLTIFNAFLDSRGSSPDADQSKADLTGITAYSLGECGDDGAVREFLGNVYEDPRLGLDTEQPMNQKPSETRKLLLHAVEYRPALNQLILDALCFGDLDEVAIAVGRLDELATLLRQNQGSISSNVQDWCEAFCDALRERAQSSAGARPILNPLSEKLVSLHDLAALLELSLSGRNSPGMPR
jgi:hypothetical protein